MSLLEETPRSLMKPRPGSATDSRRFSVVAAFWLLAALASPLARIEAQSLSQWARGAQGTVVNSDRKPQPKAIVYLQNQKTLEIKTYITTADGSYRFVQLSSDADYQLWAKYQEKKSKTKSISSFDGKKQFTFTLKLEPSK